MSSEPLYAGKTALVTGSSAGIGLEIARELFKMGVNVVVSSRSQSRCEAACERLRKETEGTGTLSALEIDLADFSSVRKAAESIEAQDMPISILVLNAGMLYPLDYTGPWLSPNNIDQTMASNHYGHFLLSELLMPRLRKFAPSLICFQGSIGQYFADLDALFQPGISYESTAKEPSAVGEKYGSSYCKNMDSYHTSKLANQLHAYELQRRLRKDQANVCVTPCFPGLVASSIHTTDRDKQGANLLDKFAGNAVSNAQGAEAVLYAIKKWGDKDPVPNGFSVIPYWTPGDDCPPEMSRRLQVQAETSQKFSWGMHIAKTSVESYDEAMATKLWDLSVQVVGLQ